MVKVKKQNSNKSRGNGRSGTRSNASKDANPNLVGMKAQVSPAGADVCLTYGDAAAFSGAGTKDTWQFRLNSVFDPDYTFTGAQPDGFDQWASFYTLYKVYKAELEVTVVPSTKPLVLNVFTSPQVTIPSTIQPAISQARSKHATCGIYDTKTIVYKQNMPDFFGADASEFGAYLYGSGVGANPAAVCYCTVTCHNADSSATYAFTLIAKLRLWVLFYAPGYLGISLNKEVPLLNSSESKASEKGVASQKSSQSGMEMSELAKCPISGVKPKRTFKSILAEFDLIEDTR